MGMRPKASQAGFGLSPGEAHDPLNFWEFPGGTEDFVPLLLEHCHSEVLGGIV
jgi:hypothetical protein